MKQFAVVIGAPRDGALAIGPFDWRAAQEWAACQECESFVVPFATVPLWKQITARVFAPFNKESKT
jgi:hypothetical protein